MRFYQATRFLFPRSFELRLLTICFVAVHVPLIACLVFSAVTWNWQPGTLIVLLIATLVGTGAGIAAIHALLSPLTQATGLLRMIQKGERIDLVPVGGDDLVGRLLRGVEQAANESADRSDRLTDQAQRDTLTGAHNRRGFFFAAERAMRGNVPGVLALLDLDHFKSINDRFGHAAGDAMLQAFAQRLSEMTRRSDICARWGGEEFAVLLPGATMEQAREVMERLRASLFRDPLPGEATVTFSCGLAPTSDIDRLDDDARRADEALYDAKNSGRDRITSAN